MKATKFTAPRKSISNSLRFKIFTRDNFTCRWCGIRAPLAQMQVDHIRPVAEGGTNAEFNLVTACVACNQGKRAQCNETTLNRHGEPCKLADLLGIAQALPCPDLEYLPMPLVAWLHEGWWRLDPSTVYGEPAE